MRELLTYVSMLLACPTGSPICSKLYMCDDISALNAYANTQLCQRRRLVDERDVAFLLSLCFFSLPSHFMPRPPRDSGPRGATQ